MPVGSRAVLIGVSAYESAGFPPIRAAGNSLQAMHALLSDPALCGWPPGQITVIADPVSAAGLAAQVADLAESATGVLLLYYAGHGVLSARGELCLTVGSTRPDRARISGLPWDTVADILRTCPARARLAILDCCFAGQAIEALSADGEPGLADIAHVQGVYTLTATTRNRTAHVPPPGQQDTACTSFTGELRDLIRSGIPGRPPQLTLGDIYPVLRQRLRDRGLPAPSQRGTDTAYLLPFTANAAARTGPETHSVRPEENAAGKSTRPETDEGTGPAPDDTGSGDSPLERFQQRRRRARGVAGMFGNREISDSERNRMEAAELYADLERIRTAPELARRLSSLAAQVGQPGREPPVWPANAIPADVDAVRSGHLIPHQDLLDAFVVACGVRPEHLEPWHLALDRVNAATGGIIELRARAIELAHAFEREAKIDRRRQSSSLLVRTLAKVQDQHRDPGGINRAGVHGQLYGLSNSLAKGLADIERRTSLDLDPDGAVYRYGRVMSGPDSPHMIYQGSEWAVEVVKALAAIQVDASGVDLSNLDLPELDAAVGVIWTAHTKWPAKIAGEARQRYREIRPDTFQVT